MTNMKRQLKVVSESNMHAERRRHIQSQFHDLQNSLISNNFTQKRESINPLPPFDHIASIIYPP